MANYPSSVTSFSTKVNDQVIDPEHVNTPQDEIAAIESGLLNGLAHVTKPDSTANNRDLGLTGTRWRHIWLNGDVNAAGMAFVKGLQVADATELTIATDAITVTQTYHKVDTEADAATDNLATINLGSGLAAGMIIVLRAENVARVVTVKDGTGNLLLNGDFVMSATDRTITLIYDGTNWRELARSFLTVAAKPFMYFPAASWDANTTTPAVPAVVNEHPVLNFVDGSSTIAYFRGSLSNSYAAGGLTVRLFWRAITATSGAVTWSVSFERHADAGLDTDTTSFGSGVTQNETTSGTAGDLKYSDFAFADGAGAGLAAGEHFRVRIERNGGGGSDTMTDTAQLFGFSIREP